MFLNNVFFENTIKEIGHRACLGDFMGQTNPIYARTSNNNARHFIGSLYILLQLEARVFKGTKKWKKIDININDIDLKRTFQDHMQATMISNRLVQIALTPFFVYVECHVT